MISLPGPRRLRKVFDDKVSSQAGLRKVFDDKHAQAQAAQVVLPGSHRKDWQEKVHTGRRRNKD